MAERGNRELEARESSTREQTIREWRPPSTLPEPVPIAGYGFRWIRAAILGESDPTNMSSKLREGWEPVRAEDHPELAIQANRQGLVEIGGLILCKMPVEMIAQREKHYRRLANDQINAVNSNFMRENDARMPLFSEHKTEVSNSRFGTGK